MGVRFSPGGPLMKYLLLALFLTSCVTVGGPPPKNSIEIELECSIVSQTQERIMIMCLPK